MPLLKSDAMKGMLNEGHPALLHYPVHCFNLHDTILHNTFLQSRDESLETAFQRWPCQHPWGSIWLPRGIHMRSGKQKVKPFFCPSVAVDRLMGISRWLIMWLQQQLAGHPLKLTHIAAISDGARQQQTLWDSCSLWSPSKLLYDSCFPDFLKARSTI